jgi:anion-transporting  ArsA/GET3 family ATPase
MPPLLDRRLVVVTGKGGVGKTTVAAALGLKAAQSGKRTIVCEVAEQERLAGLFGGEGEGYRERELAPGLHGISIDPERAKEEWLRYQLRSGTLAGLLGGSRIFQYLTAAAPGLDQLVTVGKVWELAQLQRKTAKASPYDLVIVDAPATGHGLAMLRAPRTFSEVARMGPIHRQAGIIHRFLTDPKRTGVVAVALPEEMPVNETLDLGERLRDEMGMALDRIVVNGVLPERFSGEDARRLESDDGSGSPQARAAVAAALSEHRRAREQRSQLRRLRRSADAPVTTLPFLFVEAIERGEIEQLAAKL